MVRPSADGTPDPDNWYAVQDRRERKRVQDRLAQRARRKRLADLKKSQSSTTAADDAENADGTVVSSPVMYCSPDTAMMPMGVCIKTTSESDSDLSLSSEMPMNVWTAMYVNGSMMGLSCSTSYPAKSRPADPKIPGSLQPTPLQMITIHPQWIDRFPFPQMRDNLINAISLVEEEEFLRDLFCMTSFDIKPGGAPWDPSAWIIKKNFHAKWGFLFAEQIP